MSSSINISHMVSFENVLFHTPWTEMHSKEKGEYTGIYKIHTDQVSGTKLPLGTSLWSTFRYRKIMFFADDMKIEPSCDISEFATYPGTFYKKLVTIGNFSPLRLLSPPPSECPHPA